MRRVVLGLATEVPGPENDRSVSGRSSPVPLLEGPVADVDADGAKDQTQLRV